MYFDVTLQLDQLYKTLTDHENEVITGMISLIDAARLRNQLGLASSHTDLASCSGYTSLVDDEINVTARRLLRTRDRVKQALNLLNAEKFNHPNREICFTPTTVRIIQLNKQMSISALRALQQCTILEKSGSRIEFLLSDREIRCFNALSILLKRMIDNKRKLVAAAGCTGKLRYIGPCIPMVIDTLNAVIESERYFQIIKKSGYNVHMKPTKKLTLKQSRKIK